MSYSKPGKAAKAYQSIGTTSGVMDASPHRLVQMLMEGALDRMAKAKGFIERGENTARGEQISWAMSIISGLQASLDTEAGGSIAANLNDLYDYMNRRLLDATVSNDVEPVQEAMSLMLEIKSAWDAMPDEMKNPPTGGAESDGVGGQV